MNRSHPRMMLLCRLLVDPGAALHNPAPAYELADLPAMQQLVALSQQQGVAPLLYEALAHCHEPLASQVRRQLQPLYYQAIATNQVFLAELQQVLTLLACCLPPDQRESGVVLLKGADLATTLYPHNGLRPMVDLDMLVPQAQQPRMVQCLQAAGFELDMPGLTHTFQQQHYRHVSLCRGENPRRFVELHTSLISIAADWRTPPIAWFWQQTEPWTGPQPAGFGPVLHLTPTANLLYLAAHLMLQHSAANTRLIWLYDLHMLLTRCAERIDWDVVVQQAETFEWTAALQAALARTQAAFGSPIPAGVLATLEATTTHRERRFVARLQQAEHSRSNILWNELLPLSWPARLRLIWFNLVPSPTYLRQRYRLPLPAWLWLLYYPYRWFDLGLDVVAAILRSIRQQAY